jgi:hypothetical protein
MIVFFIFVFFDFWGAITKMTSVSIILNTFTAQY